MTISAHLAVGSDCFRPSVTDFEGIVEWLRGGDAPNDHAALEADLETRGRELLRRLYQARLDELSHAEKREHARAAAVSKGETIRSRSRQLETSFGRVVLRRLGYKVACQPANYPLDKQLNLPSDLYSHGLRRRIAEEARDGSWQRAVESIDTTTGGHVPKRQAEQLAIKATKDFEAFYKQRPVTNSLGPSGLLVASSDCKGVRMLPRALREATRKEAEAEKAEALRGDPMAKKKPRLHDKRMAVVTAVWEQEALPRAANDVVTELRRTPNRPKGRKPRPHPQNKRVSASVQKSVSAGVSEMFDELDRRNPERDRCAVVLVDGEEKQQTVILDEGRNRGRVLTIVLDIIHVIHYLWLAGFALSGKNHAATDVWVAQHLLLLLTSPVADLVSTIQSAAAARHLTACERKTVDKALRYLNRNAPFLDYPTFLAQGLPIATGVIEGACRHLIQDRLGITGARWDLPGAEAMLRLRALRTSGDWDDYWRFHEQQEARRNYPAAV